MASRERLGTNSDISELCQGLARGGAASLPVALAAPSPGMCSALTVHPSLLTRSAHRIRPIAEGSRCPMVVCSRGLAARPESARGRLQGRNHRVYQRVSALLLPRPRLLPWGPFAGLGRSSFASRVNLIALGLAFWVFVLFFNAFKRVIS